MKVFIVLFAVFCVIQATSASEETEVSSDVMLCITDKVNRLVGGRNDMVDWSADVYATMNRLYQQRQRCNNLPRSDPITTFQQRMIDACNAAWTASVMYEGNRLKGGLAGKDISSEAAGAFYREFLGCFQVVDPDME
ncbi:unnamed protein product [Diamesa hyperborea]